MTKYFKLTNHYERRNFPGLQLLAYYHALPLVWDLHLPPAAWTASGATAVSAPELEIDNEIVLFQSVFGISQIVTHVVRVIKPAFHIPNNPLFPHAVPVSTIKMLDSRLFPIDYRPLNDPQSIAGHAFATQKFSNLGTLGNGVRFGHLLGIGNATDRGIQSGIIRCTASHGLTLQPNLIDQYLTTQYGYIDIVP